MKRLIYFFSLISIYGYSQFAPQAGQIGTTAIYKDSSIIVNWATGCKITRGWQDISNTGLGKTTAGDSSLAIGHADGSGIVSLGDGGSAILTFQSPIKNGLGFDFCVFENSFNATFLELAFVEVSSDGVNFFRFPATSNTQTITQIGAFDNVGDATKLNNLAGKYQANYGTPFDLQDLQGISGLDVSSITHVKIIDVVGNINAPYATYDTNNNPINDPWATPFASSGFDLDAIGVMNQQPVGINKNADLNNLINVFPNPCTDFFTIYSNSGLVKSYTLVNEFAEIILAEDFNNTAVHLNTSSLNKGFYILKLVLKNGKQVSKKIIKL